MADTACPVVLAWQKAHSDNPQNEVNLSLRMNDGSELVYKNCMAPVNGVMSLRNGSVYVRCAHVSAVEINS